MISHFNPSKYFKRHLMKICHWLGPLPEADADQAFTLPLTCDVEVNQFLIVRDSGTSKVTYLAMVTEVTDTQFTVECWGSTKKDNWHKGRFKLIHDLKSGRPTTSKPAKNVYSTPWM